MALPITRYTLDPTGVNPDNKVAGEVHTLSGNPVRGVAPTYGAFYKNSLVVYDNSTDQLLEKDVDYVCVELLQDPTLRYGQEINMMFLILNTDVSSEVRINYQVLGGFYQNDSEGIINLYETAIKDNRPVDWANVLNKPTEFNPALHYHLATDVYGYQALCTAIERIRNAIMLSDVPAYEALIDWVNAKLEAITRHIADKENPHNTTATQIGLGLVENLPVVSEESVMAGIAKHEYVTFDRLIFALRYMKHWPVAVMTPISNEVKERRTLRIRVETTYIPDNTSLYWSIKNITTEDTDFSTTVGRCVVKNGISTFSISINRDQEVEEIEQFRVILRMGSTSGTVVAVSDNLNVIENTAEDKYMPSIELMTKYCCEYVPGFVLSARNTYIVDSMAH